MTTQKESGLFRALLKHWRGRRGLSQLDLSLAAEVSARHISFLETGRAQPSREMVLRLATTLEVPLRDQNALLDAAGFAAQFEEPSIERGLAGPIAGALERMLAQQEPFPLVIMNRHYELLKLNAGAQRVFSRFVAQPDAAIPPFNLLRILFDPRLMRPFVVDWERIARSTLSRAHRESLARPDGAGLAQLVRSVLEYPDVPTSFRQPDFSTPSEPTLMLRLRRDELALEFLTTVTAFNAPQNVTLDELRIESYFPLDGHTSETCERLARQA
jgi:transcriptional regulator with XRE-family HTH domain